MRDAETTTAANGMEAVTPFCRSREETARLGRAETARLGKEIYERDKD